MEPTAPDNLNFEDILYFFDSFPKDQNDLANKKRECIIKNILNKTLPKKWFSSPQWFKIALGLKDFLKPLEVVHGDFVECIQKAGRQFNYDFLFVFKNESVKIEFKHNVQTISKYPEILSVASNTFTKGLTYAEHFYDTYLTALTDLEPPSKEMYLKNIHKNKVNDPFFIELKKVTNAKITVDESIDDFLVNRLDFDYVEFKSRIKEQFDKVFLLFFNEQFFQEKLDDSEIINELNFKKGRTDFNNTVILKTTGKAEYHLLLRWKNHAGVLYPAWQVKYLLKKEIESIN
jgi:hypothetical protein